MPRAGCRESYVDDGTSGSPTNSQVTYAYGPAGEVAATDAVGGTTRYFADARGLFVKVEDALGNATHVTYDENYNRTQVIDPGGHIIDYAYDQNGNLIKTTSPNGDVVSATYSGEFNKMRTLTDANGNTTSYAYRATAS